MTSECQRIVQVDHLTTSSTRGLEAGSSLREEMEMKNLRSDTIQGLRRLRGLHASIHGSKEKALVFGHDTPSRKRRRI